MAGHEDCVILATMPADSNNQLRAYLNKFADIKKSLSLDQRVVKRHEDESEESVLEAVQKLQDLLQLLQENLLQKLRLHYCTRLQSLAELNESVGDHTRRCEALLSQLPDDANNSKDADGAVSTVSSEVLAALETCQLVYKQAQDALQEFQHSDDHHQSDMLVQLAANAAVHLKEAFIVPPPLESEKTNGEQNKNVALKVVTIEERTTPREFDCDIDKAEFKGLCEMSKKLFANGSVLHLSSNSCNKYSSTSSSTSTSSSMSTSSSTTQPTVTVPPNDCTAHTTYPVPKTLMSSTCVNTANAILPSAARLFTEGATKDFSDSNQTNDMKNSGKTSLGNCDNKERSPHFQSDKSTKCTNSGEKKAFGARPKTLTVAPCDALKETSLDKSVVSHTGLDLSNVPNITNCKILDFKHIKPDQLASKQYKGKTSSIGHPIGASLPIQERLKRIMKNVRTGIGNIVDGHPQMCSADAIDGGSPRSAVISTTVDVRQLHGMDKILYSSNISLQSISGSDNILRPLHMERGGVVTAIVSPSLFYFQRGADTQRLVKLFLHLNTAAPLAPTVNTAAIGESYICQFTQDGNWYRAVVQKLCPGALVWVLYVDYGNSEFVSVSRLRVCPDNCKTKTLPCFAVTCGLWGLHPAAALHQRLEDDSTPQHLGHVEDDTNTELMENENKPSPISSGTAAEHSASEKLAGVSDGLNNNKKQEKHGNCTGEYRDKDPSIGSSSAADDEDEWSEAAIKLFTELVSHGRIQILTMAIEGEGLNSTRKCMVEVRREMSARGVVASEAVYVRQVLLELGLATVATAIAPVAENPQSRVNIYGNREYFKPDLLCGREEVFVYLASFNSPDDLYLQLDGPSYSEQLDVLYQHVQDFYNNCSSLTDWTIYLPKIGWSCVARSSANKTWYRARIEELLPVAPGTGDRMIKVYYVDYGSCETLHYANIRKIKDSFMELPAQALHCRLADIEPVLVAADGEAPAWDPETKAVVEAFMETLTTAESFSAIFHSVEGSGRRVVSMFVRPDTCNTLDLSHHFAQLGYAKLTYNPEEESTWSKSTVAWIDGQVISQLNTYNSSTSRTARPSARTAHITHNKNIVSEAACGPPSIGSRQAISVVYLSLVSPAAIFVRLASHVPHYNQLQSELDGILDVHQKSSSADDKTAAVTPLPGKLYIATFPRQPYVARVKVLTPQQDETVKVVLLDCGGIMNVEVSSMRELPPHMAAPKPMALLVSLHDITPPGGQQSWPCTTTDALRDLLSSLSNIYLLRQGSSVRCADLYHLKTLLVVLGYTAEVAAAEPAPFSARPTTHRVSVSQQLVQAGLALPLRSLANRSITSPQVSSLGTSKTTLTNETDNPFAAFEDSKRETSRSPDNALPKASAESQCLNSEHENKTVNTTSNEMVHENDLMSNSIDSNGNKTETCSSTLEGKVNDHNKGIPEEHDVANGFMQSSCEMDKSDQSKRCAKLSLESLSVTNENTVHEQINSNEINQPLGQRANLNSCEKIDINDTTADKNHSSGTVTNFDNTCVDMNAAAAKLANNMVISVSKDLIVEGETKIRESNSAGCRDVSHAAGGASGGGSTPSALAHQSSSCGDEVCDNISTAVEDIREYFHGKGGAHVAPPNQSKTKWLPPLRLVTANFSALPTYVDSQARIYLHPLASEHSLQMLRSSLSLQFQDSLPEMVTASEGNLQEGDSVIARFYLDKTWNRATVISILSSDEEVIVQFVDYGNEERVSVCDVRTTLLFKDLPMQGHVCRLHDIEPNNNTGVWEERVLDLLHMTVVDKACRVSVMPEKRTGRTNARRLQKIELLIEESGLDVTRMLVERMKMCRRMLHKKPRMMKKRESAVKQTGIELHHQQCIGADSGGQQQQGNAATENNTSFAAEQCADYDSLSSDEDSPDVIIDSDSSEEHGSRINFDSTTNPHTIKKSKLNHCLSIPGLPLPAINTLFPVQVSSIIDPATMYITTIFPDMTDKEHQLLAQGTSQLCTDSHVSPAAGDEPHSNVPETRGLVRGQRRQSQRQLYWQYKELMEAIQLTAATLDPVTAPIAGGLYLCYLSHSQQWHRCQMLEVVPASEVEPSLLQDDLPQNQLVVCVILLEFGCEEQVPVSRLRVLPSTLRSIPCQSSYVRLWRITNGRSSSYWHTDSMADMIQIVFAANTKLYAIIKEKKNGVAPHLVELYCKTGAEDGAVQLCYQSLIDSGLLSYTPASRQCQGNDPSANQL